MKSKSKSQRRLQLTQLTINKAHYIKKNDKNAKSGQVRYRNDKNGIIHTTIGKADFEPAQLQENLEFLLDALKKAKPANAKGQYLKKVSLSTTMGAGVVVSQASLTQAQFHFCTEKSTERRESKASIIEPLQG